MKQDVRFDSFIRLVQEKHGTLKTSLNDLIEAFGSGIMPNKKEVANNVSKNAIVLKANLAESDTPAWLKQLINLMDWVCQKCRGIEYSRAVFKKIICP